jgi:hypothetical protein
MPDPTDNCNIGLRAIIAAAPKRRIALGRVRA